MGFRWAAFCNEDEDAGIVRKTFRQCDNPSGRRLDMEGPCHVCENSVGRRLQSGECWKTCTTYEEIFYAGCCRFDCCDCKTPLYRQPIAMFGNDKGWCRCVPWNMFAANLPSELEARCPDITEEQFIEASCICGSDYNWVVSPTIVMLKRENVEGVCPHELPRRTELSSMPHVRTPHLPWRVSHVRHLKK